ncbi:retrotransposon protein, putative, unclassified [Cucumis melo var. makuwa]|uniref:Retrotransposon protein, putative, unclassified n=1 Tax=Cucumis melo var. makuwa TaxID=1194695 RepID=A0A5A7U3H9_CUCMM|nr:retrotransposon protein, putative, unclassified [Cucumis melo var. makuwa]
MRLPLIRKRVRDEVLFLEALEYLFGTYKGRRRRHQNAILLEVSYVPHSMMQSYDRKFIHNFSTIVAPITDCLKKGTFLWGNKQQYSFELLKEKLSNNPVLKLLDFSQPFEVAVDACGTGIEVILPQTGHPIEYFSKKLSPSR